MGLIYLTINCITGDKYIGKQKNEEDTNYLGSGTVLKLAIKKYGRENFLKIILEARIESEELLEQREIFYIIVNNAVKRKDFYNLVTSGKGGGNSNPNGRLHTQEAKKKMQLIQTKLCGRAVVKCDKEGNYLETYASIREAVRKTASAKGSMLIIKACKDTGKTAYGFRWKYKEDYDQENAFPKHRKRSAWRIKPILQYKDDLLIKEWASASEVVNVLGYSQGLISACCRGDRNFHKGFTWKFKEINNEL